jgi:NADP-dependent aldehyde dehydrogenase
VEEIPTSTPSEVDAALAAAAAVAPAVAATPPAERARWLHAIADALEVQSTVEELVALADRETGLGEERLRMEIGRTPVQLRYYADVAAEGAYVDATIDKGLARVRVPLGPVAVFGASNFPFLFSVLGTDMGSALASGCPVVVKAHPAHPALSARLGRLALDALAAVGAPAGVFSLVSGFDAGARLVRSPHTAAVAFTGSQRAGLALWRMANERDVVIPVFAEMGTVNPVVVTPTADVDELATGFVESFTRGTGQYCTKPGLLFAPAGSDMAARVAAALRRLAPSAWLLTAQIADAAAEGVGELVSAGGTVAGQVAGPNSGWAAPATVLSVPIEKLTSGSRLLEECFGPVAIVTEYTDRAELEAALGELQGTLAAAVMTGSPDDDQDVPWLVDRLTKLAGRVTVNEWPTGVAVTRAQQHGGPWPATTIPSTTSVGADALVRFTRPVAYQNVPDAALPPALRKSNPWHLPRRGTGIVS